MSGDLPNLAAYDALLARCPTLAPIAPVVDPSRCCYCGKGGAYREGVTSKRGELFASMICFECGMGYIARYACIEIVS